MFANCLKSNDFFNLRGEIMENYNKSKQRLPIVLFSSLLLATTSQAHHSLVGEFDTAVNFELRGTITKVEWTNPHIWIYLDASRDGGEIAKWECEMGSPNQLVRQGWKKEDLPVGTVIRTQANPSRDGTNTCSTRRITMDDGTPIFSRTGNQ
jgi:hypothetical protein